MYNVHQFIGHYLFPLDPWLLTLRTKKNVLWKVAKIRKISWDRQINFPLFWQNYNKLIGLFYDYFSYQIFVLFLGHHSEKTLVFFFRVIFSIARKHLMVIPRLWYIFLLFILLFHSYLVLCIIGTFSRRVKL